MAKIEVFSNGSPLSEGVIKQVNAAACPKCEITIFNMNDPIVAADCEDKLAFHSITSYPAVTLNGKLVDLKKLSSTKLTTAL